MTHSRGRAPLNIVVPCLVVRVQSYISQHRTTSPSMASEQQAAQTPTMTVLRLEDVYDIATRVSAEFQQLASQFGGTRLSTVIPIVLDALEQLENVITVNQQLEIRVRKLILSNDALAREKEVTSSELKVSQLARCLWSCEAV